MAQLSIRRQRQGPLGSYVGLMSVHWARHPGVYCLRTRLVKLDDATPNRR